MRSIDVVTISRPRSSLLAALVTLVLGGLALPLQDARACGCFAPPDVSQPLVQAGEEIVFAVENGQIVMHVKIRYSGRAGDFGWLLPLPSVPINSLGMPGIDVGIDELFAQLETRTQPTYVLQRNPCMPSPVASSGCGGGDDLYGFPASTDEVLAKTSPLVQQSTAGPYDYAILKADDKNAMLQWLAANRYVVPAGTDAAIGAYIRPGAYILALRLRAGAQTGDLQPVVLSYPADLPMIPLILTSVGASPNMGVLVWVLGNARAIPRNYAHTVINDAQLDWLNKVKNYNDVVTRAVGEAAGKHAFVTEYADTSSIMSNVLGSSARFSFLTALGTQRDPVTFIQQILPLQTTNTFAGFSYSRVHQGFALNGQLFAVVGAHIPVPQQLLAEGVTPSDYYTRIAEYLRTDRMRRPAAYADIEAKLAAFDPAALVADLNARIVNPTLRAGSLLFGQERFSKLTRLYTTLSPEDMTADPVFSFNASLPSVTNIHRSVLDISCNDRGGKLTTASGFVQNFTPDELRVNAYKAIAAPSSQRRETLLDTGMPTVLADNTQAIRDALPSAETQGCTTSVSHRSSSAPYLALCGLVITALLLRRRRPAAS